MPASLNPAGRQLIAALPTAFDENGDLDLDAVRATCELAAGSRADGAFVAGTTGEFLALEASERRQLLAIAKDSLGDKRLIAHIGAASARQAICFAQDAAELGITEFALLTPAYLPASADATLRFYQEVAQRIPPEGKLYAYLFRARTTTEVDADTLGRIADVAPVVGVKVSGESLETCQMYLAATPPGFEVFTGSDAEYSQVAAAGLTGVVSGISSCFPEPFDALNRALATGDPAGIGRADRLVQEVVGAVAGDIARIKTVLAMRGIGTAVTRQAMDVVSDGVRANLRRLLDEVAGLPR